MFFTVVVVMNSVAVIITIIIITTCAVTLVNDKHLLRQLHYVRQHRRHRSTFPFLNVWQ